VIVAADDPLFSMPLGQNEEEWTVWLTREKVWERYRTLGQVAVLEGGELEVSFLGLFILSVSYFLEGIWWDVFANVIRDAENS
jgi:hypothetical protein